MTKTFLGWMIALMPTVLGGAVAKPNVVLFLVDDMGWMDSGVYGSKYYETPQVDAFAKRGMRFTNAYAQPLCSPTRASLLTGQYSARHRITSATGHQSPQPEGHGLMPQSAPPSAPMLLPESKNYLEPSQITLAEVLKGNGYRTAHIGKWHLGLTQPHWPEQQGFDVAFHCHPDPGPPGEYFSPYGVVPEGKPGGRSKVGTITDGPEGEYIVDRQAAEAERFIEAAKGGPFFLNLWCYGVHGPWGHKEEYTKRFEGKKDPSGRQGNPIMASMLKSVDECFGRVLTALEKAGVAEKTVVIFTSDNGGNTHSNVTTEGKKAANADWVKWAGNQPPTRNTPLRDGKGTLYEGGTRVPLLWAWAGTIAPGTVSETVVGPIDVYPTLLDLLGVEKPAQQVVDGVSYARVLRGEGQMERRAYFNYHPHAGLNRAGGVWVRSGRFKLLRWFGNPGSEELYNLEADMSETKDLAGEMPEKVREMGGLIDGFLRETGALYPRPNPDYQGAAAGRRLGVAAGDALEGWKARQCRAEVAQGVVRVTGTGAAGAAFLGHGTGTAQRPSTVVLRLRTASAGEGKLETFLKDPGETVPKPFRVRGGAWEEVRVTLEGEGPVGTLRVYIPDGEIDVITLQPAEGKAMRWDFGGAAAP